MKSALALASVTAVLKHLLENGLVAHTISASVGGEMSVSALPPDRITTGADERPQLNLFLYQVTPNTGMQRLGRSLQQADEEHRANLVTLDLHYLVTAYGATDLQIELLLGAALHIFQQAHILPQELIQSTLQAVSSTEDGRSVSPTLTSLAQSSLGDQIKELTIKPQFLSAEELSKLWSALQARYRPSAAYKVSPVFIDRS